MPTCQHVLSSQASVAWKTLLKEKQKGDITEVGVRKVMEGISKEARSIRPSERFSEFHGRREPSKCPLGGAECCRVAMSTAESHIQIHAKPGSCCEMGNGDDCGHQEKVSLLVGDGGGGCSVPGTRCHGSVQVCRIFFWKKKKKNLESQKLSKTDQVL